MPASPEPDVEPAVAPASDEVLAQYPEKSPNRAGVSISDRIREACGIDASEAYFDFDSAELTPAADRALGPLATCFSTGPLAARSMSLVGHADPRGEESYNMVLGGKRSEQVSLALVKKGLASSQVEATSRGELDANGTDETGWAHDRRVDVLLVD